MNFRRFNGFSYGEYLEKAVVLSGKSVTGKAPCLGKER